MTALHVDIVPLKIYLARYTLYMALYRTFEERREINPEDLTPRFLRWYLRCRFGRN